MYQEQFENEERSEDTLRGKVILGKSDVPMPTQNTHNEVEKFLDNVMGAIIANSVNLTKNPIGEEYSYAEGVYLNNVKSDIRHALTTYGQSQYEKGVEHGHRNTPVGFLRQWINEDVKSKEHKLVTNEDIQSFIDIALTPQDESNI